MNQDSPIVEISNQQTRVVDEEPLIRLACTIFQAHHWRQGEVSIAIVDDPEMRRLNNRYLDHDYETDVLSFVLDADPEQGLLNGQLIVSADTAASNAEEFGSTLQEELMLYVAHGSLHLVGLEDQDELSAAEMRQAERAYLERFGIRPRWEESSEAWKRGGSSGEES